MKLSEAMLASVATGEPQPINAGLCEEKVWDPRTKVTSYCGKAGRWYVRGKIVCGEHSPHRAQS